MTELSQRIRRFAQVCDRHRPGDGSPEFESLLLAAAQAVPRYASEIPDFESGVPSRVRFARCRTHVSGFLIRTGFYDNPPTEAAAADRCSVAMINELNRQNCTVTSLILFDGLELPAKEIVFSSGRLIELNEESLRQFFEDQAVPGPVASERLHGVSVLEIKDSASSPPWGPTQFEWDPDAKIVNRKAQPWLNYLNLVCEDKCRAIGMYQKSDSLLHPDKWRVVGVEEPTWETKCSSFDDDPGHLYEYEELHRTLQIDDAGMLSNFLNRLESCRAAASHRSHRVETALRFFSRVTDAFLSHHVIGYGDDMEANEDLIVDAVAGLEAIFLNKERRKATVMARRASLLLESDVALQRAVRREVVELYRLRSAILHGDSQEPVDRLKSGAYSGERLLRRSLVDFIWLEGDQTRLIDAQQDCRRTNRERKS